jgi:hypothetical protein
MLTRDFKNAIWKRVGNEFFIRLNRLDYAFPNAFPNAFVNAFAYAFTNTFTNAFVNAFSNAFDHWFPNVLNVPVDIPKLNV